MKYIIAIVSPLICSALLILLLTVIMHRTISLELFIGAVTVLVAFLIVGVTVAWWHVLIFVCFILYFRKLKKQWLIIVYVYILLLGASNCFFSGPAII